MININYKMAQKIRLQVKKVPNILQGTMYNIWSDLHWRLNHKFTLEF